MKKWVIGNWKMHLDKSAAESLLHQIQSKSADNRSSSVKMAVCPPAVWLQTAVTLLPTNITVGSQDIASSDNGAHTGDISASMVASAGARLTIIGHSERRANHAESDVIVAQKMQQALAHHLLPVICVGESSAQRDKNCHLQVIGDQLKRIMSHGGKQIFTQVIVAYEPIWAIGTGRIPTDEQICEVHTAINALLKSTRPQAILYGGSVKADNAAQLAKIDGVDGFLVGGASLQADDFIAVAQALNS